MRAIAALREELSAGRPAHDALSAFVRAHTFPILEDDTAIFFFWDGRPADGVTLRHWVFGLSSDQPFHRIDGTDAFVLAVQLPHDGRVEYKLEVHRGGERHWMRDPLNPRRAFDPFGSNSVCPMPGYREPGWVHHDPSARRGRLEAFTFHSRTFGDERRVVVYLPYEYRPHRAYRLLICHDGSDYLRFAGIRDVLDNLITRHEVRPILVAFIDGHDRNREFGADPRHPTYVVQELLPQIEARYRIIDGPRGRGLMGASFGGVASLYTAWTHPGVFGHLLLQSGSFVFTDVGGHGRGPLWDPVVGFVNAFRRDPARIDAQVFQSCGTFESLIAYNRALVPVMRQAGLAVRFREAHDGHNWIAWRDQLRDGLTWLFPGHLWMTYD